MTTIKTIKSDKREVAYMETGDSSGFPILYAHGSPGTALEANMFDSKAREYGFRFIAVERPGMGHTPAVKTRQMSENGGEILAVADQLNIEKFSVMGWSGGGAPALATAFATPKERLMSTLVCAGYTNLNFAGAHQLIPPIDRLGFFLSRYWRPGLRAVFAMLGFFAKRYPEQYIKSLKKSISDADNEMLKDLNVRQVFIADQKACFSDGALGVTIDAQTNYLPWDFSLSDIDANAIDIFHGTNDKFVPYSFSEHSINELSRAKLHALEGDGHLFPFHRQDAIFSCLREHLDKG